MAEKKPKLNQKKKDQIIKVGEMMYEYGIQIKDYICVLGEVVYNKKTGLEMVAP